MNELTHTSTTAAPAKAGAPARALSAEEQLSGDMLMLTTGFMMCAAMLWLAIYWSMGYQYSTAIPLVFQESLAEAVDASQRGSQIVRNTVGERLELLVGDFELRRPVGDALLELIARLLQLSVLILNPGKHLVEGIDQNADLVAAVRGRAGRKISALKNVARGLGEIDDRLRNVALKPNRYAEGAEG